MLRFAISTLGVCLVASCGSESELDDGGGEERSGAARQSLITLLLCLTHLINQTVRVFHHGAIVCFGFKSEACVLPLPDMGCMSLGAGAPLAAGSLNTEHVYSAQLQLQNIL